MLGGQRTVAKYSFGGSVVVHSAEKPHPGTVLSPMRQDLALVRQWWLYASPIQNKKNAPTKTYE
jgi:hypothetical protein